MRIGSLFSGVGGLDLAVENTLGARTVWHVDNDPAATRVLAHHWPDVANHGDITRVGLPYSDDEWAAMKHRAETDPAYELPAPDWSVIEPIDVLVGGWPCQDLSSAGKRAGIQGARSGLYTHLIDAVRVLRPRYVVLENVAAVLVRGFDLVVADVAACGYDLSWLCLPASDVGAPHRRDRFFAVAHADGLGPVRPWSTRGRGADLRTTVSLLNGDRTAPRSHGGNTPSDELPPTPLSPPHGAGTPC